MCYDASENFAGNKTLVCLVGDLDNGDQYRTPDGDTMLVVFDPTNNQNEYGSTKVVSIRTGVIVWVADAINLGLDRRGRLYASRSLNPAATIVAAAV